MHGQSFISAQAQGATKPVCLFLQGPSSPLFAKISDHLRNAGWTVLRINLNVGDQIFWRRPGATNYRGSQANWPLFIRRFMEEHKVTDMVLLGEERDYHRAAIIAAKELGINRYVAEMGYLRPDWVTIEREGQSSNSLFPSDPQHIIEAAKILPEPEWTPIYKQTFLAEACYDLLYNLPNVFFSLLYPGYKRHALFHPLAEYAGWLRRLTRKRREQDAAKLRIDQLIDEGQRYFVYPLQLETDFQLRAHSPYYSQQDAISEVLQSFAQHAPKEQHLVIKLHPLDNDLINWRRCIVRVSKQFAVESRIHFIDGGDLDRLIKHGCGMVTVNSSAALNGLRAHSPVKVLGSSIYDTAGLTDQQPLAQFWTSPVPPKEEVLAAFFRLLAASIQVRGNLYSQAGSSAAAQAIADRLIEGRVNLPGALQQKSSRQKPHKRHVAIGI